MDPNSGPELPWGEGRHQIIEHSLSQVPHSQPGKISTLNSKMLASQRNTSLTATGEQSTTHPWDVSLTSCLPGLCAFQTAKGEGTQPPNSAGKRPASSPVLCLVSFSSHVSHCPHGYLSLPGEEKPIRQTGAACPPPQERCPSTSSLPHVLAVSQSE